MKTLITIICFALAVGAIAAAQDLDLSKVTEADILKTVEHMQEINREVTKENASLRFSLASLTHNLKDALTQNELAKREIENVQTVVSDLKQQVDDLVITVREKDDTIREWKTFGTRILVGVGILVAVLVWQMLGRASVAALVGSQPCAIIIRAATAVAAGVLVSTTLFQLVVKAI